MNASGKRGVHDRYVDGRYVEDNPDWHDSDAVWKAAKVVELLRAEGVRVGSICDVGCGSAGVLSAAAPELGAARVVGFERSPDAVALAGTLHPEVEVVQGDAQQAIAEGDRFDVALVLDVVEHVDDYPGFLRSLRPLASHHVFHIPLEMSVSAIIREGALLRSRAALGHIHYFSKGTALAALEDAGYSVMAARFTATAVEITRGRWRSRLASVPRRAGSAVAPDLAARVLGGYSLLVLATPAPDAIS